ncbi:hypothetical protein [Flagellimonas sp.]|uniref:hypothetical protein n=1 Tax=Flagellimonas sp. TaxID=2058762 RepID=UPI003F4A3416
MYLLALGLLSFSGCSVYKAKKQESLLSIPELGSVVHLSKDNFYTSVDQVGVMNVSELNVSVSLLPFNRVSYVNYARGMQRAGKINSIPYVDSLPYKPKYLRVQLANLIEITKLFNNDEHQDLRTYISHDDSYKLVSALDIAISENDMDKFMDAQAIQLKKNKYESLELVVIDGNQKSVYPFRSLHAFKYHYTNFCWGEGPYGNIIIENLVAEDEKCPKGTRLKARKVSNNRYQFKF